MNMISRLVHISVFAYCSILLYACTAGSAVTGANNRYEHLIDSITRQYAPDKRVAIVEFQSRGNTLLGKTSLPEARQALLSALQQSGLTYIDSILVLPDPALQGKVLAITNNSVSNIRSEPRHGAELSTQATLGTPLRVWEKRGSWYRVQLPDEYLGWVDAGGIELMDSLAFARWEKAEKIIYTGYYGFAYNEADQYSGTVADLVYGNILTVEDEVHTYYLARFPDGRRAYIPKDNAVPYSRWAETRTPSPENLVASAKHLMGVPYLWGGTSFKGVDCSGFTKTVYFMNGLVIPRDASQQVHVGDLIDTAGNWSKLRPGDLLFFGRPAEEGRPERVVHVGMWIGGNLEFIHSSSQVRVSSMNPKAENFDKYELSRFLRAKRIQPDQVKDLRKETLFGN